VEHYPDAFLVPNDSRIASANSAAARLLDAVRRCLNLKFRIIGRVTTISVDSQNRTINLQLDLRGESAPVEVKVHGYTLREEKGAAFLELGFVETSRKWVNALLERHFPRRRVEVTGWEKLIKALL